MVVERGQEMSDENGSWRLHVMQAEHTEPTELTVLHGETEERRLLIHELRFSAPPCVSVASVLSVPSEIRI